jgi:uncharacterized membrane protein
MRVRQFERHYFGQMFAGAELGDEPWLKALADDLRHPHFRLGLDVAITRRLRRNYAWMFLILLLGWLLKIGSPKLQNADAAADTAVSWQTVVANAALGPIPGWLVIVLVLAFYAAIGWTVSRRRKRADEDEVHV